MSENIIILVALVVGMRVLGYLLLKLASKLKYI
jgi:hypothetical protein